MRLGMRGDDQSINQSRPKWIEDDCNNPRSSLSCYSLFKFIKIAFFFCFFWNNKDCFFSLICIPVTWILESSSFEEPYIRKIQIFMQSNCGK